MLNKYMNAAAQLIWLYLGNQFSSFSLGPKDCPTVITLL